MRETRWDADEDDFDDDVWDEDDDGVVDCPYCGEEMLEDSPRCSECGRYLSEEDRTPERKPSWIVVGVVLCVIIVLAGMVSQ